MKESYMCFKNSVFINDIKDYKINVIKRQYQDNIEEILKTENMLEALEIEKQNYKESIRIKKNRINHKKQKNLSIIIASVIIGLFTLIINFFINPLSNLKILFGILTTLGSFSLLSPTFFNNLRSIKILKKELDGINLANKILLKKEKEAKELLDQLNKDKTISKTNLVPNETKKVEYLDKLNELKSLLGLYCSIGANESEFKKYYEEKSLDLRLSDNFSKKDIEEIKTYFKTKRY